MATSAPGTVVSRQQGGSLCCHPAAEKKKTKEAEVIGQIPTEPEAQL